MTTQTFTPGVTLSDTSWATDVDTSTYSALTALAGQHTLTATGPASMVGYATGQAFRFKPVSTNTVSTTLNITANSVALGAKNIFFNGAQLSGGEIVAGTPCMVVYDGTQFEIVGPTIPSRYTNSLSSSIALTATGTYFTGPQVPQGTVGTWFVSATVTAVDVTGGAVFSGRLTDGTTVIASTRMQTGGANVPGPIALSGYITNPAGNLRVNVKDETTTTGQITFNNSGNPTDSTITAIRIG